MNLTRNIFSALTLTLALATGLATPLRAETLRVGEIHPITGPAAFFGVPMTNAVHLAAKEINSAGGVKVGDVTYELEIVTEDDQSNPSIGVGALKKLQNSGIHFIIGPLNSPVASALYPIIGRDQGLTQIIDGATSPGIVNGTNVFRTAATLPLTYEPELLKLLTAKKYDNIAIITDRTHSGWMGEQPALVEALKGVGTEVLAEEYMQYADTDFSAQITKIKSLGVKALVMRAYPNESAIMTKQARQLGFDGDIIWCSTPPPATIKKNISNELMEGVLLAATYMTQDYVREGSESAQKMYDAYKAAYGAEPGELSVMSYDSVYVLKAALEKAGSIENAAVNAALQELTVDDVQLVGAYTGQDGGRLFNSEGDPMIAGLSQVWEGLGWSFLNK
ncbi:MAG: ABC transporter substrate-binding protein [Nitratireductor sp.]